MSLSGKEMASGREGTSGPVDQMAEAQPPCLSFQRCLCYSKDILCFNKYSPNAWIHAHQSAASCGFLSAPSEWFLDQRTTGGLCSLLQQDLWALNWDIASVTE